MGSLPTGRENVKQNILKYIMWGAINQRCYSTFPKRFVWSKNFALTAAKAWKIQVGYSNSASWPEMGAAVEAGYHDSGAWPLEKSLYSGCELTPSNVVSGCGPFEWAWEPIRHRY